MPADTDKNDNEKEQLLLQNDLYSPPRLPIRYIIVFMTCTAVTLNYGLRMNWSVSILSMVRQQNQSQLLENQPDTGDEEFNWDLETQQQILGIFYFGFSSTSILGGWLVGKYGGFPVLLLGVALPSLMALVTPISARISVGLLLVTRVIDGVGQSFVSTAYGGIIAKWAPVNERSTFVSIIVSGSSIGAILGSILSTWICTSPYLGGWPSTFYTFGICGIVWCFVWCIVGSSEAANHRWISSFEKDMILKSQPVKTDYAVPWKKILSSVPMWSLCVGLFCILYGYYLLYADIPTFLEKILGFNITESGLLSVAPHFAFFVTIILGGIAADKLISSRRFTVATTRKLLTCSLLGASSILLVLIGYIADNVTAVVILQILVFGLYGLGPPGVISNAIDIAPNHSGLILGIAFTIAGISGYIGPAVVGVVTRTHNTMHEWREVFWITAVVQTTGLLVFLFFSSGDVQF